MDASRAAFALLVVASAGGCFLVPSPDDAWSDDFGRAPLQDAAAEASDAPAASEGGACAASSSACVSCCDSTYGLSVGSNFFALVFDCVCPGSCASSCGTDCEHLPDPNDECLACLAGVARANESCFSPNCASTTCHGYATCIGGCEP